MRKKNIQYIFFDVDGVLVHGYHSQPELRVCWDENLEEDFGVDRELFTKEFIFGPFIKEVLIGKKDLKSALKETLPILGCNAEPQAFIDYWLKKDSNVNYNLLDKVKLLKDSGQTRLFIATNQAHDRAQYLMRELGLNVIFEDIFYSAQVGAIKPDIAYFQYISDKLNLNNNPKPIFFDDTPAVVTAAREFGWDAFEFRDISSLDQSHVVHNILNDVA